MHETISETVAAFDQMTNELFGPVLVMGSEYDMAELWNKLDPIAYKCGWIDWCDAEGIDTDELEDDYTFDRDLM